MSAPVDGDGPGRVAVEGGNTVVHRDALGRPIAASFLRLDIPAKPPYINKIEVMRGERVIWRMFVEPVRGRTKEARIVPHDRTTTVLVHYDDGDVAEIGPMD